MKSIKMSFFMKMEIKPFVLGAFLSRIMEYEKDGQEYFYAYSSYQTSKFVYPSDFNFKEYPQELLHSFNKYSGHTNWCIHTATDNRAELRFYIYNDINITKEAFYRFLYQKLMSSAWVLEDDFSSISEFIRGFIELRGSVDTSRKLIAQDYFYNNRIELKKALILPDVLDIPDHLMNFNARNLQQQFVEGSVKRNAQFRINAFYYANKIGFLNDYKAKIFDNAYYTRGNKRMNDITYFDVDIPQPSASSEKSFINRLNFFTNNIYEKNLTDETIKRLRDTLGFDSSNGGSTTTSRDQAIISIFREISEDKCALCGTTTTFLNKNTGRQHFEIHHVISVHNGKQFDNIANLVKLCPTCHDSLKKNHSTKSEQVKSNITILHNHPEVYEFCRDMLGIDNINDLAEKIQEMLG